jgi:hypothetical protein
MVVVGVVAALLAVLANPLGIGSAGFGWHQVLLLVVGLVLAAIGAVVALRAPSSGAPPGPDATPGPDVGPGPER